MIQKNLKIKRAINRQYQEHYIQSRFFSVLAIASQRFPELKFIFAIPNGGYRSPKTASILKSEGVKPGVADVFVPLTSPIHLYCGLWIEFKSDTGVQKPEQVEFQKHVEKYGYLYRVCRSTEEAIWLVEDYLGLEILVGKRPPKEVL